MMCFNKRVVGGLAVVALGMLVVAPGVFRAALPLLVMSACPLSMVFMMRGTNRGSCAPPARDARAVSGAVDATPRTEVEALRDEVAALRAQLRDETAHPLL